MQTFYVFTFSAVIMGFVSLVTGQLSQALAYMTVNPNYLLVLVVSS